MSAVLQSSLGKVGLKKDIEDAFTNVLIAVEEKENQRPNQTPFLAERQILRTMTSPNIEQVLGSQDVDRSKWQKRVLCVHLTLTLH